MPRQRNGLNRTFTDLTYDMQNDPSATWCPLGDAVQQANGVAPGYTCLWAPSWDPSGPASDRRESVEPDTDLRGFGWRRDPHGRHVRRHVFTVQLERAPPLSAGEHAACASGCSRGSRTLIDHIEQEPRTRCSSSNVAINPAQLVRGQGGTQDNGTWSNTRAATRTRRPQIIYGDGGNAGYDGTNPTWRFNEFTSGFSDSNFKNGDPEKWVISSAPIVNSGEAVAFYWPQVADPNPVTGAHPIFSGAQHVWRTWAFGAGTPGRCRRTRTRTSPSTRPTVRSSRSSAATRTAATTSRMGGPQALTNQPGDLTGTSTAPTAPAARSRGSRGTEPTTERSGRPRRRAASSSRTTAMRPTRRRRLAPRRQLPRSPTRFPSSIYPDPEDTGHAWITYSGYNASTPTTPGHVFSVNEDGAAAGSGRSRTSIVESGTDGFPTPTRDGDLPVTTSSVTTQKASSTSRRTSACSEGNERRKGNWTSRTACPGFEVMHLEIEPSARVPTCVGTTDCPRMIYAATHSQGIWALNLPGN